MKLVRQTKLAFKEGNSDKIYEVDLCETGGFYLVNFRYGRRGAELKEGTKTPSAVALSEAEKIFQKLVDEKTRKGYHEVGAAGKTQSDAPKRDVDLTYNPAERDAKILEKLSAPNAKSHPKIDRVIWRAGELQIKEAAPLIVNFIGTAKELRDYCCAWALGMCGDESVLGVVEKLQKHQSEAVRRIAFEAILKISPNAEKFIEERFNALPEDAKKLIKSYDSRESANNKLAAFLGNKIAAHKTGELKIFEDIYVIVPSELRPAISETLLTVPLKPKFFKTIRHIFKIAEFRRDAQTFGILAKRFAKEQSSFNRPYWGDTIWKYDDNGKWRSINYKQELKSPETTLAFSNSTKAYLTRRSWRTLRRLGEIGDNNYVKMCVGALLTYTDADAIQPYVNTIYDYNHTGQWNWQNPKITEIHYDSFAPYLLLNRIIYGNSPRYEYKTNSNAFRMREGHRSGEPAPDVREEAFPKLWEEQPVGLLHLLAESKCKPVHEFAVKALRDCPKFLTTLDVNAVKMLLASSYNVTAKFGFDLAQKFYDAANPDKDLILAVAFANSLEAQEQGFRWIEAHKELFIHDASTLLKILTSDSKNVRKFGRKLVYENKFEEAEAQNLIAIFISEIVSYDESKEAIARDFGKSIYAGFAEQLKNVNLDVALDLLQHPLIGVQILGAKILSNHATPAENLPNDLINSLIASPYEEIRKIGVEIFGKLSDENLVRRESVIMNFLTHEFVDIHDSTRPIVKRLAEKYPEFADRIANDIFVNLLVSETSEGLHSRLLAALKDIPNWTKYADFEAARLLTKSDTTAAQEAGGIILRENAEDFSREISVGDLIDFTNNEIVSVRRASWDFAERNKENLKEEVSELVRSLDTKFEDSREFWFEFFDKNLTEKELTPEVLVAIADSVKPPTQKLGRDLLQKYFKAENGAEYLLKLSEHPAPNMQLFATNYLENHAADSVENLRKLAPYFTRVFSLVNRARTAKERSLNFLEKEALKSAEAAEIAAEIYSRQSATMAIGDRARMIQMMVKVRQKFPEIAMPITVKETEVRAKAV